MRAAVRQCGTKRIVWGSSGSGSSSAGRFVRLFECR